MNNPWDERYANSEYIYGKEPNTFLKQHIDDLPQGHILSLAEGEGRNAVFLAKRGRQVSAVDSSSVGLEKAARLAEENAVSVEFIQADLGEFEMPAQAYNGIVSIFCHVSPPARSSLYSQLSKAIKPGGIFLLEAYTPEQVGRGTGGPPVVEFTNTLAEMKTYLQDFDLLLAEEIEREVIEGTHHTGMGSVLQIIAKRKA